MKKNIVFYLFFIFFIQNLNALVNIENEFVKVIVEETSGRFVIKTTSGDPDLTTDENKLLLYEEYPPTSFTVIRIDGKDYKFGGENGSFNLPPVVKDNTIVCTWTVNNIEITQLLEFALGINTGRMDSVKISYAVVNKDFKSHEIGIRILLDTFLGRNDGSPFRIPSFGEITTETVFMKDKVPDYWYAYDDLGTPTVRAQGTLKASGITPPDMVVFASWPRFEKNWWDINPIEGRSFRRGGIGPLDSACAVYWNPVNVDPQNRIGVSTMYGLYGATILKGEIFSLSLGGPTTTKGEDVIITADIQKVALLPAKNVKAEIILPEGLSLAPNETNRIKSLGTIESNNVVVKAAWTLRPDGRAQGEMEYTVVVKGEVESKEYSVSAKRKLIVEGVIPQEKEEEIVSEPEPEKTEVVKEPEPVKTITVLSITNFDFSRIDSVIDSVNRDIEINNSLIEEINKKLAENVKKKDLILKKSFSERSENIINKSKEVYPNLIKDASTNFIHIQNVTNISP